MTDKKAQSHLENITALVQAAIMEAQKAACDSEQARDSEWLMTFQAIRTQLAQVMSHNQGNGGIMAIMRENLARLRGSG